jgi:orotidine-5'-phosphate decarboxylase
VPRFIGEARRAMPKSIILLPGVGAQGASPGDVARAFTSGPASAVVNASRSVIYAYRETDRDWRVAAGEEAARLAAEIRAASGW